MRQIEPYHRGIRYRTVVPIAWHTARAKKREDIALRATPLCLDPSHAAHL